MRLVQNPGQVTRDPKIPATQRIKAASTLLRWSE